jgi:hypothetical protein
MPLRSIAALIANSLRTLRDIAKLCPTSLLSAKPDHVPNVPALCRRHKSRLVGDGPVCTAVPAASALPACALHSKTSQIPAGRRARTETPNEVSHI